ncbi:MAG TPA: hypothetical protein VF120_15865 [Ktedonobacterales bacterium]
MAQITIPDEQYATLVGLARERGVSLEELVAALIEQFEHADQVAFWGEGIVEDVRRQVEQADEHAQRLSEDEFFAQLKQAALGSAEDPDANV